MELKGNTVLDDAINPVEVDLDLDLAIYEKLPSELREALRYAPHNYSARDILIDFKELNKKDPIGNSISRLTKRTRYDMLRGIPERDR